MLHRPAPYRGLLRSAPCLLALTLPACLNTPALADETEIMAEGSTEGTPTVTCTGDLSFGIIALDPDNPGATVVVEASAEGHASTSAGPGVFTVGPSGSVACEVADSDGAATAALSADTGTEDGGNLSGVELKDGSGDTLAADLVLSKTENISDETLYVGGTLHIPASHTRFGAYSETITLTVTD